MPTLSEADSKALLSRYGVTVPDEAVAATPAEAATAAARIGFPVAVKLCGHAIAHKTERGLVHLGLRDEAAVQAAAGAVLAAATPADGPVGVLVSRMVRGARELIAGAAHDPQFGPCVMLGVGGVLAELTGEVVFRLAPLTGLDADELIDDLRPASLLGPVRGEPAVDRAALAATLTGLGRLITSDPRVRSVDCNPLIVAEGAPVAVDALVELA
ncbi:MAG TPA: acetate--CoA ligase family protein [Acidimicrobiales bacterium]|nr:acetate--CoA ligase family protein [Acidimicrobiales bacterium]